MKRSSFYTNAENKILKIDPLWFDWQTKCVLVCFSLTHLLILNKDYSEPNTWRCWNQCQNKKPVLHYALYSIIRGRETSIQRRNNKNNYCSLENTQRFTKLSWLRVSLSHPNAIFILQECRVQLYLCKWTYFYFMLWYNTVSYVIKIHFLFNYFLAFV